MNYLDVHEHEGGGDFSVKWTVSSGDGTRVDVEVALVLVSLELVGLAADEDVAIELPVQGRQRCSNKNNCNKFIGPPASYRILRLREQLLNRKLREQAGMNELAISFRC